VSSYKLVCPHCGHDGTPETAKPPLGSCGFNYLADDVVCREVRGHDESGKLRLSSDFRCQGSRGTNPRLECRSCWQTFPVPEGVLWAVSAEQPPEAPAIPEVKAESSDTWEAVPVQPAADAGNDVAAAAGEITKNLAVLIRGAIEGVDRVRAGQIAGLEAGISSLARTAEEIAPLGEGLAALRLQAASLGEAQQLMQSRLATIETVLHSQDESQSQQREQLRSLSTLQEDGRRRLEDQARIVAGLEEQGRQLQQSLQAQQDSLNERVENLGGSVLAEAASQLGAACAQLQQGQEQLQKRLDAQAEAIRTLHLVAQERVARKEDLQAAVQKLEEIAGALDQIKPLPKEI
jgi:hypothetical protein